MRLIQRQPLLLRHIPRQIIRKVRCRFLIARSNVFDGVGVVVVFAAFSYEDVDGGFGAVDVVFELGDLGSGGARRFSLALMGWIYIREKYHHLGWLGLGLDWDTWTYLSLYAAALPHVGCTSPADDGDCDGADSAYDPARPRVPRRHFALPCCLCVYC